MPKHMLVQQDWYIRGEIFMLPSRIRIVRWNKSLLKNCSTERVVDADVSSELTTFDARERITPQLDALPPAT